MKRESVNRLVLLFLVAIISAVFLTMIHRFLMPIFMAGLVSAMAAPGHRWITERIGGRENIGSALIILAIIFLILGPLTLLVSVVVAQAIGVGQSITPFIQGLINEPTVMSTYLEKLPYYQEMLPYRDIILQKAGEIVGNLTSFLINSLSSVTRLTVSAVFGSIIMLYVMFYFLTMGNVLLRKILYFLPLQDKEEQRLLQRFTSVARATIKGTLIIGLMQGSICGLAFALAGIKGPVFWGTVMAVTSVIPAFGTAIVWGPALVILAVLGNFQGVALLVVVCGAGCRQPRQRCQTETRRQGYGDARSFCPPLYPGRHFHVRHPRHNHWSDHSGPVHHHLGNLRRCVSRLPSRCRKSCRSAKEKRHRS